jgi:hypothetical protein
MQVDLLFERPMTAAPVSDRVRLNTPKKFNDRIDEAMMKRVWDYARKSPEELSARIAELDREWDLERVLETGAGALALGGMALSVTKGRLWLILPASVLASLLQHCLTRKSPGATLLRGIGVRTRREIDAEKYALRMLRGDFDKFQEVSEENHRAIEALRVSRS